MTRIFFVLSLCVGLVALSAVTQAQDKAGANPPNKKDAGLPKVTAGNVTYVVTKSSIGDDGLKWTVVVEATCNSGDKKILIQNARAIASDGKTFDIRGPMGKKPVSLPEGVRIQLELKMGDLPKNVKTLSRIELFGDRNVGIPGFEYEKGKGIGFKKAAAVRPLVLENVSVERPEK